DPDALEFAGVVESAFDADDGVATQQQGSDGRRLQVDLSGIECSDYGRRQRISIDLDAHAERGGGIERRDNLVHPQHVGPELLVAERVETKDLPAVQL